MRRVVSPQPPSAEKLKAKEAAALASVQASQMQLGELEEKTILKQAELRQQENFFRALLTEVDKEKKKLEDLRKKVAEAEITAQAVAERREEILGAATNEQESVALELASKKEELATVTCNLAEFKLEAQKTKDKLVTEIQSRQEAIAALKSSEQKFTAILSTLSQEINSLNSTKSVLQTEIDAAQQKITDLQNQAADLVAKEQDKKVSLVSLNERLLQTNAEIVRSQEDLASLQREAQQIQSGMETINRQKFILSEKEKMLQIRENQIKEKYQQAGVEYII